MDSIASFTIETGGLNDHVMYSASSMVMIDVMPSSCYSEKMLWNPSIQPFCVKRCRKKDLKCALISIMHNILC